MLERGDVEGCWCWRVVVLKGGRVGEWWCWGVVVLGSDI